MDKVKEYGNDILMSDVYQSQKSIMMHGHVSVYEHCVSVSRMCLKLAHFFHLPVNERAMVRGALLHDYFLYDWHEPGHSLHGFTHPKIALANADRDFDLNAIERDMIVKHMFPLTYRPPKYRETIMICLADKIVALKETINR